MSMAHSSPRACVAVALLLLLGCDDALAPLGPPQVRDGCEYRPVPGAVEVGEFSWNGATVQVQIRFGAEGSPYAARVPALYRESTFDLPCAQCVSQLGIRRGASVPVTARVETAGGACAPFELGLPWDRSRCDCSVPLRMRLQAVVMSERGHTLPLDSMGRPPNVEPPPTAIVAPPSPISDGESEPMSLTVDGSPWSCTVRFVGAGGRATSASVHCSAPDREPVVATGTCDGAAVAGPLAELPTSGSPYTLVLSCAPDYGDGPSEAGPTERGAE